jgi:tRNA threonylcarbamoyl adenosine modification protein (Sua5/YciO/YrdC/YwlC family)
VSAPAPARPPELESALATLGAGALLAFPTETVWGLGADARSESALARLRAWKGRGDGQPIALLVPDLAALEALGAELSEAGRRLAAAFWPGPLTLVLRCAARFAAGVAGPASAVGFRCSPHPAADALARAAWDAGCGPVTATSLNRSGEPPARTRAEAAGLCRGQGAPRLFGGSWPDAGGAAPSSVVDCTGAALRVLREGALSAARLERVAAGGAP